MSIARIMRLSFEDEVLRELSLPRGTMKVTRGVGSGLATRFDGGTLRLWAVGDRGPNLKPEAAAARYGLELGRAPKGAKLMPCLDIGPTLVELSLSGDRATLQSVHPLVGSSGRPISGLPTPRGAHAAAEPVVDLAGAQLGSDPSGADTEGVVALRDGGFWVSDEYGPSLMRLDAEARVLVRWVPEGTEDSLAGAPYPVEGRLPALAARRHINRGFEGIALSPDERHLYVAFQSPLAHPGKAAHAAAAHVRLWTMDAESGAFVAQHLYPLDPPKAFRRDCAKGEFARADIKLSELCALGDGRLICLERGSETTKLYVVSLDHGAALPGEHMDAATRPTVEELSARGEVPDSVPVLEKTLLLDTDHHAEIGPDLEGIALLAPDELLLVSDNDFGVEGAATGFWRVRFAGVI